MITQSQIQIYAHQAQTNESTIFREYLQILFLQKLYQQKKSEQIFFKGGTAIHLLLKAPRFSEDLDFTVAMSEKKFDDFIAKFFSLLTSEDGLHIKQRESIVGKQFLLTAPAGTLPYATFIHLDFSFREKALEPAKSSFDTVFPLLFTSYIFHLSALEMCAEKVRALSTRKKGRDIFDLWYLISQGVLPDMEMVKKKLAYYAVPYSKAILIKKINEFSERDYIADLRPFIPINQRNKLSDQFKYVRAYLTEKLPL
jgi:predicted nucleotidyltransferase component of viral defense system